MSNHVKRISWGGRVVKLLDTYKSIIKGKDFLTMEDVTTEELNQLLDVAIELKEKMKSDQQYLPLQGKILGMIFEKNSTRTRVSFEAGMIQLGGQAIFLSSQDTQLGRGEPISDTAKVLSEYVDGLMIRTHSHKRAEELAEYASVPVINGLTDFEHPCQALADLLTIKEEKGKLKGLKLAYVGDGNNVAHSLLLACVKSGMHISIASPEGYEVDPHLAAKAVQIAKSNGGKIEILKDVTEAVQQADIIYNDVWTSMGQEKENEIRLKAFKEFQVNDQLVSYAKKDYVYMHCLPAHRGEEVTSSIIDSTHSIIYKQAGNRLHAQKALLVDLLS